MTDLQWDKLLSSVRRKDIYSDDSDASPSNVGGARTEIERDYDRILFSTPVRRLADKTQVFPLEKNDSVRTRLTHSHEVSNLARSIGVALAHTTNLFDQVENASRDVPAMLAAIGLAHDIGNPPFGHQGEVSIGSWFSKNIKQVFGVSKKITKQMKTDYIKFEGNAQALRILTKLQILNDQWGLNVTCGSLAALMKYPTNSDETRKDSTPLKKFGYFLSEEQVCRDVWGETGLKKGVRHPLAYIMEACDDIAYSVLDAEDAIKKGLVSYRDLVEYLRGNAGDDASVEYVLRKAEQKHEEYKAENLSPSELNDVSMQMLRVFAIGTLVNGVVNSFSDPGHFKKIMRGKFQGDLIAASSGSTLCRLLKGFSFENAYKHQSVLELELRGHKVIHSLMDMIWPAIVTRGDPLKDKDHIGDPFEKYVYGRISENYRRIFEDKDNNLPLPYKRAQLLGDMMSGMTDNFAIDFEAKLESLRLSAVI